MSAFGLKQADLAGIRQVTERSRILQHLHMGLGNLRTGQGNFLDRKEMLALAAFHQIPGRAFTETGDSHKGRQDLSVLDEEFGGIPAAWKAFLMRNLVAWLS